MRGAFDIRERRTNLNKVLFSSKKMDWCTPKQLFNRLDKEFHFVLDAAATAQNAKCSLFFTPETDGLSQSWDCGGAVFCNPPYGRDIGKWVKKAYEESIGGGYDCFANPCENRHGVLPRLCVRESRNSLLAWAH